MTAPGVDMAESELIKFPSQLTASASAFHEQHLANIKQFSISDMITSHQEKVFVTQLHGFGAGNEEAKKELARHFVKFEILKEYVSETRETRIEVALTRAVDNFLCYVSDILTEAMIVRPELLKSQEQVSMQEVLQHGSIEEFIQWAAEQHVNQLSFKGLGAISEYIQKRLGLQLSEDQEAWNVVKRAVAVRNLAVHRRRIIDERFIHSMGDTTLEKGQRYAIPPAMSFDVMLQTMRIVQNFDTRISAKFKIPLLITAEQPWYSAPNGPSSLDREREEEARRAGLTAGQSPSQNELQTDPNTTTCRHSGATSVPTQVPAVEPKRSNS
ncbi:hypothetical protein [Streptomyces griseoaurantiacus]|uniref:hypothetical protein n=1 Tax=Streptomyces griseoaurantiacus TaxID=68213 RepID=UPI0011128CAD|nr:hypothetical protein [Streptomyces griseoaurantiacus]